MSMIPKRQIVKETTRYDDLLDVSPLTKELIKNAKPAEREKLFAKNSRGEKRGPSVVKIHLRDRNGADAFARLIQQELHSSKRKITFAGRYDERKKTVRVSSRTAKHKWIFVEDRPKRRSDNHQRKTWNTDDFFNRQWIDMPPFENEKNPPFVTFEIGFKTTNHKAAFAELIKQRIFHETKSIWFPYVQEKTKRNLVWIGQPPTNKPRYPVFIISKNRAKYGPLTAKVLRELGVPFYLMVEPHEYDHYKVLCDWAQDVFVIPESHHGAGPGRARNACWDVAKNTLQSKRHWVLDDNIRDWFRLHQNERIRVGDGTIFHAAEDFVDRYTNVPVAGFAYKFFHPHNEKQYPFKVNTRIYSCLLIDNDCPYRWRGRYNEDTILSLDVLKGGHSTAEDLNKRAPKRNRLSTIEFVAFSQDKLATQTMKGGNTAEFYVREGTAAKSVMLVETHPDVAHHSVKYGREHHDVDYEVFRGNWLIRTEQRKRELSQRNWKPNKDKNPYGMKLLARGERLGSDELSKPEIKETLINYKDKIQVYQRPDTSDDLVIKEVFSGAYSKLNIRPDDVVLDVGMNIGMFTAWAIKKGAKKVFSYEPDKDNYELAKRNLSHTKIAKSRYRLFMRAVTGTDEPTRDFFINSKKNKGEHTLLQKRGRSSVKVKCVNINTILQSVKPTVVKMDIEGGEYECLKAISSFAGIRELIFEFHHAALNDRKTHKKYREICALMRKHFSHFEARKNTKNAWVNIVYCRNRK